MKQERGHGRPEGAPKNRQASRPKELGQTCIDTISSIRADRDLKTFVADLRQNKKQLLSLTQRLMRNRGNTRDERAAYLSIAIYLDAVLKQHVFHMDPFAINRPKLPDDEELKELKEVLDFDLITRAASRWLKTHPYSQAAKAVSKMGHYAFSDQHQRLLQEMWPSIRVVAGSAEGSASYRAEAEAFLKKYVYRRHRS